MPVSSGPKQPAAGGSHARSAHSGMKAELVAKPMPQVMASSLPCSAAGTGHVHETWCKLAHTRGTGRIVAARKPHALLQLSKPPHQELRNQALQLRVHRRGAGIRPRRGGRPTQLIQRLLNTRRAVGVLRSAKRAAMRDCFWRPGPPATRGARYAVGRCCRHVATAATALAMQPFR